MAPLFTVATITYNSSKWIRQAIESILASSFTDFELLISDDCSTDDTWQIISEYKDPRIKAWRNETNLREYPNRNKVLNTASGRYILFVDGDDILYKHSLRNLAEYISAFPEAGMLWGLNPQFFPFYIFPYLVQPAENIKLIYCTHIPISTIWFGEIVFKTAELKKIGGFSNEYRIGDTYIKKKLALQVPVLYISIGIVFWRQSDNQASKIHTRGMNAFVERSKLDDEILASTSFPGTDNDRYLIRRNIRISRVKLFVSATLLKGKLLSFFKYRKQLNIAYSDLGLMFKKGDYSFRPSPVLDQPLSNRFNFI